MKANAPIYSLNAGEISKIALARVDVAKLRMAAACQLNWLPYVVGPMTLRSGLYYIGEILGDAPAKLIRFIFSKLDTALIELTTNQMRIWIDEVLVSRVAVGTSISDPWFLRTRSAGRLEYHIGRLGHRRRRSLHPDLSTGRWARSDTAKRNGRNRGLREGARGPDRHRAGPGGVPGRFHAGRR